VSVAPPKLGRYRVDELLGSGGMALVYRGHDARLQRVVAIKLLADNLAEDDSFRRRFVREARTVARLAHPNVVRIYDVGESGGRPYFVMEFVDGETLAGHLRRRQRLPVHEAVRIADGLASGLEHAHGAGLVHRDVKPHNVLLTADGGVKIVDFGIARLLDETAITLSGSVLGTAAYLAPEQALGGDITPAADVYALGVVVFEMVAGRVPFGAARSLDVRRRRTTPSLQDIAPDVPAGLDALVRACLTADPSQRPTAADVAEHLRRIAAELPTDAVLSASAGATPVGVVDAKTRVQTRVSTRSPGAVRSRRGKLLWLAAGVALVLALALTAVFANGSPSRPEQAPTPPLPSTPAGRAHELSAWLRAHAG
jgi:eukaryotic-like serine/threonine-protein kinase